MYFIALAGTGLRYDPRVCLAAGGAALLQYGAIVTWVGLREPSAWVVSDVYGTFQWDSQTSRLQLIAVATIIHAAVVVRSRAFWLGSMRDQLTGLFNRGYFDESFARLVADQRSGRPFTVAIIDLDDFKSVNDRYGHAAGDEALRFAAGRLREAFRDEDIIARYGGEEFAVILRVERATAVARLDAWRAGLHADARIPRLSASVGAASMPEDGSTRTLLEVADRRLYAAKASGRNRTVAEDQTAA
jgi:diguanylate cyclase (GGDEF)-like protein